MTSSRRAIGTRLVFCTILTLCISTGMTLPLDSRMSTAITPPSPPVIPPRPRAGGVGVVFTLEVAAVVCHRAQEVGVIVVDQLYDKLVEKEMVVLTD